MSRRKQIINGFFARWLDGYEIGHNGGWYKNTEKIFKEEGCATLIQCDRVSVRRKDYTKNYQPAVDKFIEKYPDTKIQIGKNGEYYSAVIDNNAKCWNGVTLGEAIYLAMLIFIKAAENKN
jgi:hypothetical protein